MEYKIKDIFNKQSAKIAGVVGTGIHLYSLAMNNEHFQNIQEDFANERYVSGTLKATFPIILPYLVSSYTRIKTQKTFKTQMKSLENKLKKQ